MLVSGLLVYSAAAGAVPPLVCPAGAPIGNVDLRVRHSRGGSPLPLKTINRLEEGDSILYRPILRASETRKGEVSIVLIPAVREPDQDHLTVLPPKPANQPAEWQIPSKSSVAAFVYGPAGLNRNKVKTFLSKDDELVAQLADYAEKTQQTEALIQALSSDASSGETVNAAFRGFASQYGMSTSINRTQPTDQQMVLALRTLNPAVAGYDPISSTDSSQRFGQTASLATSVAALFFGSPVGLAAGGTAMLMEMRSMAFPNTVFRSSFAQTIPDDGLGLCGRRDAVPAHTKVAYLWATRIPNIGPPHIVIGKAATLAAGMKAPIPVEIPSDTDRKYLSRARKWTLEPEQKGGKSIPVPLHEMADPKTLEIDLTKAAAPPGRYYLVADWDWERFEVTGAVTVAALSDFEKTRLEGASQDRLVTKSGRVPVTLDGSDFEFVTKVELAKPGDKFFTALPVPFALPEGFRQGAQAHMDVQVNTSDLDPGDYRLMVTQADGKPHAVPMAILPSPPKIDNLPVLMNRGDASREITLKGERLNLFAEVKSPDVKVVLEPPNSDGTERKATVRVNADATVGQTFDLQAYVENRHEPIDLPRAVKIVGPRARITDSRLSLPPSVDVALKPGELPSGYPLSALLHVTDWAANDALALECRDDAQSRLVLAAGVKSGTASVERLAAGELFVTFDDSTFPNGCTLVALAGAPPDTIEGAGYELGRIVRVPRIQSLQVVEEQGGSGQLDATLTGEGLELIERIGWDPDHGTPVPELPSPIPGEGQKQNLRIPLPAGSVPADAPLYVWLRGESTGRASVVRAQIPSKVRSAGIAAKTDGR